MNELECIIQLEECYLQKTEEIVGFNLNDLSIEKQNVIIKDCKTCKDTFRIKDTGLYEDNVALFWYMCKKECRGANYCAGLIPEKEKGDIEIYRFCYDESSIHAIEEAIKLCDYIRACDVGSYNTLEICRTRIKYKKDVDAVFIDSLFKGQVKSKIQSRKRMWRIIDEGLRRLYVAPKRSSKNELDYDYQIVPQGGLNMRAFHGHQLMDLIKRDRYSVLSNKEDILSFGHFHLLMILFKYNTWIMITGHFTGYRNPRKIGFLSHIGAPILRVDKNDEPSFILSRYPDVMTEIEDAQKRKNV